MLGPAIGMMKALDQDLQGPDLDIVDSMEITDETLGQLLGALSDQLQELHSRIEMVVIGGSALTALGLVKRAPFRQPVRPDSLQAIRSGRPGRRATRD